VEPREAEHPRNLIPELCRQFYNLGWVTGTGGGITIKRGLVSLSFSSIAMASHVKGKEQRHLNHSRVATCQWSMVRVRVRVWEREGQWRVILEAGGYTWDKAAMSLVIFLLFLCLLMFS